MEGRSPGDVYGKKTAEGRVEDERSVVRVLMIDDDREAYDLVRHLLETFSRRRYRVDWAESCAEGRVALDRQDHDVYLIDYALGDGTGHDLLEHAGRAGCDRPLILLTSSDSDRTDLTALELGAADYLEKRTLDQGILDRSIRYSVHQSREKSSLERSQADLKAVLSKLEIGLLLADQGGLISYSNRAANDLLGGNRTGEFLATALPIEPADLNDLIDISSRPEEARRPLVFRTNGAEDSRRWLEISLYDDPRGNAQSIVHLVDRSDLMELKEIVDGRVGFR